MGSPGSVQQLRQHFHKLEDTIEKCLRTVNATILLLEGLGIRNNAMVREIERAGEVFARTQEPAMLELQNGVYGDSDDPGWYSEWTKRIDDTLVYLNGLYNVFEELVSQFMLDTQEMSRLDAQNAIQVLRLVQIHPQDVDLYIQLRSELERLLAEISDARVRVLERGLTINDFWALVARIQGLVRAGREAFTGQSDRLTRLEEFYGQELNLDFMEPDVRAVVSRVEDTYSDFGESDNETWFTAAEEMPLLFGSRNEEYSSGGSGYDLLDVGDENAAREEEMEARANVEEMNAALEAELAEIEERDAPYRIHGIRARRVEEQGDTSSSMESSLFLTPEEEEEQDSSLYFTPEEEEELEVSTSEEEGEGEASRRIESSSDEERGEQEELAIPLNLTPEEVLERPVARVQPMRVEPDELEASLEELWQNEDEEALVEMLNRVPLLGVVEARVVAAREPICPFMPRMVHENRVHRAPPFRRI